MQLLEKLQSHFGVNLAPNWSVSNEDERSKSRLAERFWSLARSMDAGASNDDPILVVKHVLAVLDALDTGEEGAELTANTVSFLALLHQSEAQGDLLYASPEQARGERMDERSLVFSVGVLIFEKLTGRHPFGADGNPRRLARIQKAEMASGVTYFQTISGPLRSILLKCMGPFPDERWRSMAELRDQLEAFVKGTSTPRKSRNLPALPYEDDDNEATTIMAKPASLKALQVAAARESERRPHTLADVPLAPPATTSWLARVGWMASGGALVGAALWIAGGRSAGETTQPGAKVVASQAAPASGPAAAAPMTDEEERSASGAQGGDVAAPGAETLEARAEVESMPAAAAAAPKAEAVPLAASAPASAAAPIPSVSAIPTPSKGAPFDPELGAQLAMARTTLCFSEERQAAGLQLGISLRYGRDGLSQKLYFGGGEISQAERLCMGEKLIGLSAGGAPEKPVSVRYSFWIGSDSSRYRARLEK